ncbi:MAG: hypothetical protein ACJ8BF_08095 [Gemmatimonadales bacterium]
MIPPAHRLRTGVAATVLFLLGVPGCARAQREARPATLPPVPALPTPALAGKKVGVLPLTLLAADPTLQSDTGYSSYRERRPALHRADSIISEALLGRAPEVTWVLPPELRKIARRSAGFTPDPDEMGQAILRAPKLTTIPDPLRSSLRNLMAVADARLVFVPAALGFGPEPNGQIRAELTLVLCDARTGKVMWRSAAQGRGKSPDDALNAALAAVLPAAGGP